MFSGLLSAAPAFAGRIFNFLKPAFSTVVDYLASEGGEKLAEAAAELGMNSLSKGIQKGKKVIKMLTGKKRSYNEAMDNDINRDGNMLAPEDDDAAEYEKYLEMKKMRGKKKIGLPGPAPEYLREDE